MARQALLMRERMVDVLEGACGNLAPCPRVTSLPPLCPRHSQTSPETWALFLGD